MHGYMGWGDFFQESWDAAHAYAPAATCAVPPPPAPQGNPYAIVIHGVGYTYEQVVGGFFVDVEPDVDVVDHGFGVERRGDRWYIFDPYANVIE